MAKKKSKKSERDTGTEAYELVVRMIDEDLGEQLAALYIGRAPISDEEVRRKFITTMQFRDTVETYWGTTDKSIHDYVGRQAAEEGE